MGRTFNFRQKGPAGLLRVKVAAPTPAESMRWPYKWLHTYSLSTIQQHTIGRFSLSIVKLFVCVAVRECFEAWACPECDYRSGEGHELAFSSCWLSPMTRDLKTDRESAPAVTDAKVHFICCTTPTLYCTQSFDRIKFNVVISWSTPWALPDSAATCCRPLGSRYQFNTLVDAFFSPHNLSLTCLEYFYHKMDMFVINLSPDLTYVLLWCGVFISQVFID